MSELTPEVSQELQYEFLYHLWKLVEETKRNSVKVSEVWKRMNVDSNKDNLLPIIIGILKDVGEIQEGDKHEEVKLIYKKREKQRLYILDVLNNIVNDTEGSLIGVTLTIGGTVITGNLISIKKYYSLFFEQMKSAMPEKEHPNLANAFNSIDKRIFKTDEEKEVMSKIIGRDIICLENPSYFMNGKMIKMGSTTTPWIGRIEKVDAFILGIFNLNVS